MQRESTKIEEGGRGFLVNYFLIEYESIVRFDTMKQIVSEDRHQVNMDIYLLNLELMLNYLLVDDAMA